MSDTCKHNWIGPQECPHCCADQRDQLSEDAVAFAKQVTELQDKLKVALEALERCSESPDHPSADVALDALKTLTT